MQINRLLITGAAGGLGKMLRQSLAGHYPILCLSSRSNLDPAASHDEGHVGNFIPWPNDSLPSSLGADDSCTNRSAGHSVVQR